jgi:hypothetical protein
MSTYSESLKNKKIIAYDRFKKMWALRVYDLSNQLTTGNAILLSVEWVNTKQEALAWQSK